MLLVQIRKQFLHIQTAIIAHLCILLWRETQRVSHKIALWGLYSRYFQFANEMSWPEISNWTLKAAFCVGVQAVK